jgi:hypothetical protein
VTWTKVLRKQHLKKDIMKTISAYFRLLICIIFALEIYLCPSLEIVFRSPNSSLRS